jgi:hypothetical protein
MKVNSITVGTTPVRVPLGGGDVPVLINNGETDLYFGDSDTVSVANGVPLGPSSGYEFSRTLTEAAWPGVWVVSDAPGGDLRYGTVG